MYHIIQLGKCPTAPWPTRGMPSQSLIGEGFSAWHSLNLTSVTNHFVLYQSLRIWLIQTFREVLLKKWNTKKSIYTCNLVADCWFSFEIARLRRKHERNCIIDWDSGSVSGPREINKLTLLLNLRKCQNNFKWPSNKIVSCPINFDTLQKLILATKQQWKVAVLFLLGKG